MKSYGMGTGMGNCKPHGSMGDIPSGSGETNRTVDHASMGEMGEPAAKSPAPGGKSAPKGNKKGKRY